MSTRKTKGPSVPGMKIACNLDPCETAGEFLLTVQTPDGVTCLRIWRGSWLFWKSGRWREIEKNEVRAMLIKYLNEFTCDLTTAIVNNLMDQLQAQCMLASLNEQPCWIGGTKHWPAHEMLATCDKLIHLPSYVAGLKEYSRPATPFYFSPTALEFKFNPQAGPATAWLAMLTQAWPDDPQSIDELQKWFGYCLVSDTRQQKICMLVGPKRSGKGTVARILRALVGMLNVAGPTLAGMGGDFGLWPLIGKSLAIISDARLSGRTDSSVVTERLLSISGEDALTINRKNMSHWTGTLPTRLMLLSNELPRLGDSSGALASRMLLLRMTRSWYGQEDHGLTDKLMAELPAILLWAIEGWAKLQRDGRFIQPDSAQELLADLEDLTSPIGEFIRERCQVAPAANIARRELYAAYCDWCKLSGRQFIEDQAGFGRNLRAAIPTLGSSYRRTEFGREYFYEGVTTS